MKKLLTFILALLILCFNSVTVFASSYTVNPFYAIRSLPEYEKVKDILEDANSIYYEWARITMNTDGKMILTGERNPISKYDLYKEYSIPESIDGKLTNEIHKNKYPNCKNLLTVFFNKAQYEDGKISVVDFLNMDKNEWDINIINPIIEMIDKYKFDGIALDFEGFMDSYSNTSYDASLNSSLKEKYNTFLGQLKNKLQGRELSICVNMPGSYNGYDYSYIYSIADHIILLAYSYEHYNTYNESDGIPALNGKIKEIDIPEAQPYDKIKNDLSLTMKILSAGQGVALNSKKILLGMTFEVNGWIEKEYLSGPKAYIYYESTTSLERTNKLNITTLEEIDSINAAEEYVAQSPTYKYLSKTCKKVLQEGLDNGMRKVTYYYESSANIYEKYYSLVQEYNLAGVTTWRLGLGSYAVWNSMNNLFNIYGDSYDELLDTVDVPRDKVWSVKFNSPIDDKTLISSKESIGVIDLQGNLINTTPIYDSGSNTVKITPVSNYKPGQVYYLIVGMNIKSNNGKSMKKPVIMRFIIKNDL